MDMVAATEIMKSRVVGVSMVVRVGRVLSATGMILAFSCLWDRLDRCFSRTGTVLKGVDIVFCVSLLCLRNHEAVYKFFSVSVQERVR